MGTYKHLQSYHKLALPAEMCSCGTQAEPSLKPQYLEQGRVSCVTCEKLQSTTARRSSMSAVSDPITLRLGASEEVNRETVLMADLQDKKRQKRSHHVGKSKKRKYHDQHEDQECEAHTKSEYTAHLAVCLLRASIGPHI